MYYMRGKFDDRNDIRLSEIHLNSMNGGYIYHRDHYRKDVPGQGTRTQPWIK